MVQPSRCRMCLTTPSLPSAHAWVLHGTRPDTASGWYVGDLGCIETGRRLGSTKTGLKAIRQVSFFLHFLPGQPTHRFSRWAPATPFPLASSTLLCLQNLLMATAA